MQLQKVTKGWVWNCLKRSFGVRKERKEKRP